jgi:ankyrin repeat protein
MNTHSRHISLVSISIAIALLCINTSCRQDTVEPIEKAEISPASTLPAIPEAQFIEAALEGKLKIIQQALQAGTPVDALGEGDRTALMLSAFNGHTAIVKALIGAGASVHATDAIKRTALMYASTGPNPDTVQVLLSAGAEVNAIDGHEDWTSLMFAAAEGHQQVVDLLLANKANPTLKDADGDSAAAFARQRGFTALAQHLEEAAAKYK